MVSPVLLCKKQKLWASRPSHILQMRTKICMRLGTTTSVFNILTRLITSEVLLSARSLCFRLQTEYWFLTGEWGLFLSFQLRLKKGKEWEL